jgi:predicted O-methyltransferase YrrM
MEGDPMSMPSLDELFSISQSLRYIPDKRPDWMKKILRQQSSSLTDQQIDAQALYYRLFYEVAERFKPGVTLEIGTYIGGGTTHLAFPNPCGTVITVDINPDAKIQVEKHGLTNIRAFTCDSTRFVHEHLVKVLGNAMIDLLYIDGNHTFNQAWGEYVIYRPFVKEGGLIFFDDLALQMETGEMEIFWQFIPDKKLRMDDLHFTGFGVAKKTPGITPQRWEDVIPVASELMKKKK